MRHNIPVTIRNVFNVAAPGTVIGRLSDAAGPTVPQETAHDFVRGFTTVDNIALVNVEGYILTYMTNLLSLMICGFE